MSRSTIMRTILSLLNCVRANTIFLAFFIVALSTSLPGLGQAADPTHKTFTVVIDPGHGGKDPGALGKTSKEKDIALAIAKKTGDYISRLMNDVNVLYTRKTDEFIDLSVRANIATESKADLFLSIHVNGNNNSSIYGAETYVMGPSKSERNFELAQKENSVINFEEGHETTYDFDPNDPASYIMFSTVQNTFLNQSLLMASQIQDQLRIRAQRKDGGVRQGPFLVLWRTTMPSVLVETGYISNKEEEKYLNTDYGQDVIASAIYRAFRNFKEETLARTEILAAKIEDKNIEALENHKTNATFIKNGQTKVGVVAIEEPSTPISKTQKEEDKKSPAVNNSGGLIFRVQVIASPDPIPPGSPQFKKVSNLEEIQMDGYYKYMSAPVKTYSQSQELRKELKTKFPGAFVVAFLDGNKIPLQEGISMDKLK